MGLDSRNNSSPSPNGTDPSSPEFTMSNPGPPMEVQNEENWGVDLGTTPAPTVSRKRLRVEFGRLGRNIRQRLLCGLCHKEGTSNLTEVSTELYV